MSDEGGDEMARRRTSPAAEPLDDEDLLAEILLRLPVQPSSLLRASLVCKRWRSIATDAAFRRRFRAHHRKPPVLGFFQRDAGELVFKSVLEPPDRIPRKRFALPFGTSSGYWIVVGCRHGRVLAIDRLGLQFLVFHPVSGDLRIVPIPPEFDEHMHSSVDNGAVLCAAGDDQDHVHGDCHSSPFKVVLVGTTSHGDQAIARVYSSETGMWGDLVSMAEPCTGFISCLPCTLVGNALYWWWLGSSVGILHFDLDNQSLAVISSPPFVEVHSGCKVIRAKDGGVGVVMLLHQSFQMWDRKVDSHGAATWLLWKTANMHDILGLPSAVKPKIIAIAGYADESDVVSISVHGYGCIDFFIVDLESMQSTKCCARFLEEVYYPFADFYMAGAITA